MMDGFNVVSLGLLELSRDEVYVTEQVSYITLVVFFTFSL